METGKRELEVLLEFSRAANAAVTVDSVLREIVKAVREGFGYDRAAIFLTDPANPSLMCGAIATDDRGRERPIPHICVDMNDDSRWAPVLEGKREYLLTEDAGRDIDLVLPSGKRVKHHVVVPLTTPQRLLGSIAADNAFTDQPITEAEAGTLLAFGRQAAVALQNVQLIEELRNSEERLRSLVTSLTETLYSVRIEGGSVTPSFYSPQLEHLTGFTPDEALKTPEFWRSVTHPEDRLKVDRARDELMKGRQLSLEYRIRHRNGEVKWVLDTPVPVESPGPWTDVNGSILDITDRKELEDRLRRAQRMETVGTLAGGVAHNFNNYLQIVMLQVGEAESLLQQHTAQEEEAVAQLRKAQSTLETTASLAKQLMAFGRKVEGARSDISLDELVARTLPLVQSSLGKSIRVEHLPDPDAAPVVADAAQMQQVLINLCINARDAMPAGGVITVRTQNVLMREHDRRRPPHFPPGEYVRLQVHDTGTGIDASVQERIFEPFFTTKPVGRGTGLGLAVTYTIVTEHGGWIDVESEPGKGTLFSIYLPSAEVSRQVAAAQAEAPPERIVLVVDPVEQQREHLASVLESLGVDVMTAEGVSDAMAIIWDAGERLDAVLCSIGLGGVDVAQLLESLQSDGTEAALIVTGERGEVRDREQLGVSRDITALTRPYTPAKVAEALHIPLETEQPVRHAGRRGHRIQPSGGG
jgi:two-component system cell cycle sensor histidine kinase/response regulator CckA